MLLGKIILILTTAFLALTATAAKPTDCESLLTENIRKELDLGMWVASQNPDAGRATQLMLELMSFYPFVTFADFERSLRRIGSPMHLVATPRQLIPEGLSIGLALRGHPPVSKNYFVFVAIHGQEEAEMVMTLHGIHSQEENLRLLAEDTGVLIKGLQ